MQKLGGSFGESHSRSSSTSRQSHWSSLLSVFQTSPPSSSQSQQQPLPTSTVSVNDATATSSATSGGLSSTSRMFVSELNVASHSLEPEQGGSGGGAADDNQHQPSREHQRHREMRRQRQQADSALHRLDRLVAVDIEPPLLPPPTARGRHRTVADDEDVARRLSQNSSPVAVVIDGRTRLSDSRQSTGSSSTSLTTNRSARSSNGQSAVPQVFVPPPPMTSGRGDEAADPPGTPLADGAVDQNSDRAVFQRRLSRTRRGGTSAGSSNSRSSATTSSSSRASSAQRQQTSSSAAGVERKLPDVKVVQGQSVVEKRTS